MRPEDPGLANARPQRGAAEWVLDELRPSDVGDLLILLDKTIRARRFYQAAGPVYEGFVQSLRAMFAELWSRTDSLVVDIEEQSFTWNEVHRYSPGEARETLPFLFYKDGVRQLVFLPGFEEEVERFVRVVDEARRVGRDGGDDMVTLLWEQEFASFQYGYVDVLAEGVDLPGPPKSFADAGAVDFDKLLAEIQTGTPPEEQSPAVAAGQPPVAQMVNPSDFAETLYFLDDEELARVRAELEHEESRDFKESVLDALFDRLEDDDPSWGVEIFGIFRQLLPVYLGRGDLASAARIVTEVSAFERAPAMQEAAATEARALLDELSGEGVLNQLLLALEEGSIEPDSRELGVFLEHLGPASLPRLIQAAESTRAKALQVRLRQAMEGVARMHPEHLIACIRDADPVVGAGAARLAGAVRIQGAIPALAALTHSADSSARRAAIDALVAIGTASAMQPVVTALEDDDREVRIAAARGIASTRYRPALEVLGPMVSGRGLRDADLTERIAFFEAYGAVTDAKGVSLLADILNGRRLLGKPNPELRACAALALGKAGTPAAREALQLSASDPNPVVRNAVVNAMRGGAR